MSSTNLTEIQGEIHEGVGNQSEHLTDDHQVENNDKESIYSGEDVVDMGLDKVLVREEQLEEGKPEMGIVERRLQTLKKRLSGLLLLDSDSEGDTRPSHISEDAAGEDGAGEDAGSLDGRSVQDDMGGIGGIVHIISKSSGGNINPAVSFALFLDRRISLLRMAVYIVAQFIGGFIGAGVLYQLGSQSPLASSISGGNNYDTTFTNTGQAFTFEAFGTMFLILTIMATINEDRTPSYLQPLSIGVAIFVIHVWLVGFGFTSLF
eukprot:sb/3468396/